MSETIKGKLNKCMVAVVALLLALTLTPAWTQEAYAAQDSASLTVTQQFAVSNGGSNNVNRTVTYRLTANQDGAPMPNGASGNTYDFVITGNGESYVLAFNAGSAKADGTYTYTLKAVTTASGDDANSYSYDTNSYTLTTRVQGTPTKSIQLVAKSKAGDKVTGDIIFSHSYTGAAVTPGDKPITEKIVNIIKTGDTAQIALIAAVALASLGALILILLLRKKRKAEETPAEV